jgi:hypothetical protein
VPAGTAAWATSLVVTKAITIQGAGIGQTILQDNIIGNGTFTSSVVCLSTTSSASLFRVTGISFQIGTLGSSQRYSQKGMVTVYGPSQKVRIDHCRLAGDHNFGVCVLGLSAPSPTVYPDVLIDHNIFDMQGIAGSTENIHLIAGTWGNDSTNEGHVSWASAPNYGTTTHLVVIEDNVFSQQDGLIHGYAIDTNYGARFIFRHNTLTNMSITCHGGEEALAAARGTRLWEIYNNKFLTGSGYTNVWHPRSGSGVLFNNTADHYGMFIYLTQYRATSNHYFFKTSDGHNPWDYNYENNGVTVTHGTPVGGPFYSGTCTAAGLTPYPWMEDSTKSWTANQLVGYSIRNLRTTRAAPIMTNNAGTRITKWNQATILTNANSPLDTNVRMQFTVGDQYEIRKIANSLDAPGMGQSDLITSATPTAVDLHQVIDGVYEWSNTLTNMNNATHIITDDDFITSGKHYFINTQRPYYPSIGTHGVHDALHRIGADSDGAPVYADDQWGYTYPHPLISR